MNNKKYASLRQKIAINDFLKTVCATVNGFAQYKQGWSDQSVADTVNASVKPRDGEALITVKSVSNIRRDFFGTMEHSHNLIGNNTKSIVADLVKRVEYIEKCFNIRD